MIRIPSIPPPEELARRPARQAFALAMLDAVRQVAASAAVVVGAGAVILGLGWTSLQFGEWVHSVLVTAKGHAPGVHIHALVFGAIGTLGMFFALTGIGFVSNWIEARAGHAMPSAAKLAVCAAWWAVVCSAVWTLT